MGEGEQESSQEVMVQNTHGRERMPIDVVLDTLHDGNFHGRGV